MTSSKFSLATSKWGETHSNCKLRWLSGSIWKGRARKASESDQMLMIYFEDFALCSTHFMRLYSRCLLLDDHLNRIQMRPENYSKENMFLQWRRFVSADLKSRKMQINQKCWIEFNADGRNRGKRSIWTFLVSQNEWCSQVTSFPSAFAQVLCVSLRPSFQIWINTKSHTYLHSYSDRNVYHFILKRIENLGICSCNCFVCKLAMRMLFHSMRKCFCVPIFIQFRFRFEDCRFHWS